MLNKQFFEINDQYRPQLESLRLNKFEQLMSAAVGEVLESEANRESRRIEYNGKIAYLKRQFSVSKKNCFESSLLLSKPHTPAVNEHIYIRQLKQHKFAVMNVMAVGEQRKMGVPTQGFILVDEVKGHQMDHFLNRINNKNIIHKFLAAYGQLIARLHYHGFYAPLRVKDVIITDVNQQKLVMIDREVRYPYPRAHSQYRALRSLRDTFRRTRREFKKFSADMETIVVQAYHRHKENR